MTNGIALKNKNKVYLPIVCELGVLGHFGPEKLCKKNWQYSQRF